MPQKYLPYSSFITRVLYHSHNFSVPESDRLPSDCSFRRDICLMKEGRMHEAQEQKTVVEDIQRQDRKLRKAAANS
jgi:hypothetical protein